MQVTQNKNTINKYKRTFLIFGVLMRKLVIILLLVIICSSGCASKETKYVSEHDDQRYVTLSSDGTAFYHTGGVENYKGTWKEVDGQYGETEITVFMDDGSSLVFRQKDDYDIMLKVPIENNNGGIVRYYKED